MLDTMDIKILTILQEDSTLPVAEIGKKVGLSTTPCWRRIQKLEQDGVIEKRVALLNPKSVGAGVTVFVAITTNQHNSAWLERFHGVVESFPEIVEAYRMSGQVDYLLRVAVPDIAQLRPLLQGVHLEDRPHRREFELRHGADQVHHGAAALVRGQRRRKAPRAHDGLTERRNSGFLKGS